MNKKFLLLIILFLFSLYSSAWSIDLYQVGDNACVEIFGDCYHDSGVSQNFELDTHDNIHHQSVDSVFVAHRNFFHNEYNYVKIDGIWYAKYYWWEDGSHLTSVRL